MKSILSFEEIVKNQKEQKEYMAIGDNGKEYHATYDPEYQVMFFAIPASVEIIGYKEI